MNGNTTYQKKPLFIIAIIVIIVVLFFLFFLSRKNQNNQPSLLKEKEKSQTEQKSQEPMYGDYKVKDIYKSETPKNAQITEAKYTQSISKNSEMDIKSRRYELAATKNGFIPYDITVNALDTIELDFIAVDGDYDLTIPFLGTSFNAVKKGDKKRFTFQITNTGVFAFQCNQFCPEGKIIKGSFTVISSKK